MLFNRLDLLYCGRDKKRVLRIPIAQRGKTTKNRGRTHKILRVMGLYGTKIGNKW